MAESVWDYPRPPSVEPSSLRIRVELGSDVIVDTTRVHRVLETSHPPVYYVPVDDVAPGVEAIRDAIAFYPGRMDACFVDDERVVAQPGDFYGGWITSGIVGPFKGEHGRSVW